MFWKVLLVWLVYLALHFGSLLLPHRPYTVPSAVNLGLQFLLFLLCLQMVRKDAKPFRPALINLTVLFGFSVLLFLSIFIGPVLFPNERYASVYYRVYVNKFGHNALLIGAVVYLIVDYILGKYAVILKYTVTLSLAGIILLPLYAPYLRDPLHLYRMEEYSRYLDLKDARDLIIKEKEREPTEREILERALTIRSSRVTDVEDLRREWEALSTLTVYLAGGNATILFWKPLNLSTVYVNAALLVAIAAFYFLKYRFDKPHAAYFEKIIFLFFPFCFLQVLHPWVYTVSVDHQLYLSIHEAGQYLTIVVLLAMVYVCSMRLRFITSPVGKYYQQQVALQPERISRWRDEVDTLILVSFLKKAPFLGRLGVFEKKEESKQGGLKGET